MMSIIMDSCKRNTYNIYFITQICIYTLIFMRIYLFKLKFLIWKNLMELFHKQMRVLIINFNSVNKYRDSNIFNLLWDLTWSKTSIKL